MQPCSTAADVADAIDHDVSVPLTSRCTLAVIGTRRAEAEAASSPAPQPKRLRPSVGTPPVPGLSKGSLSRAAAGIIAAKGGQSLQEPSGNGQVHDGDSAAAAAATWSAGDGRASEVSNHQILTDC